MYGFESSKKIRQIEDIRKSGIPIIALTTSIGAALEDISNNEYIDDCFSIRIFRQCILYGQFLVI